MRLYQFTQIHYDGHLFFGYPVGDAEEEIIFQCTNGTEYHLKKESIDRYFQNGSRYENY